MVGQLSQTWYLILISVAASVAGQTVIKLGMSSRGAHPSGSVDAHLTTTLFSTMMLVVTSPLILIGLAFYGAGALSWIAVLGRLDLSYAYPFLALNFVLITLAARLVLGEEVSLARWVGILVICAGVLLVARTSR